MAARNIATEANPAPVAKRLLGSRVRLWGLAVVGSIGMAVAGLSLVSSKHTGAAVEASRQALRPDVFQPTPSQWAGLTFAAVGSATFRDERATDGKIGVNEDTTTPVYSPYSGRVSRLIARPGDRVERGAPLFAIEASEFVQGHNDLVAAVAAVEKARARLGLAQMSEKRQRDLLAIRGGAMKDVELAQSELVATQGDLRSAEIALGAVRSRLRILGRSDIEIDRLEKADSVGAETIVASPIDGTVLQRKVGPGQYINAGASEPVFAIGNLSRVWLIANVRESDAPLMKVGAPVEMTVPAYPGRTFSARLSYVSPSLDPNSRRLAVRAEIDNEGAELLPEMFASYRIATGEPRRVVAVPQQAVVYEGAAARVWTAQPADKTVAARDIEVGAASGGLVEVRSGLKPGETVVTGGTLFIDRAAKRD